MVLVSKLIDFLDRKWLDLQFRLRDWRDQRGAGALDTIVYGAVVIAVLFVLFYLLRALLGGAQ